MANYYAFIRTNYFSVTDESKFLEIIDSCLSEDKLKVFTSGDKPKLFGFGCYGSIYGIPINGDDLEEVDIDAFYEALQNILADDDVIIITEIGYEKLRYLLAHCTIITKMEIRFVDLRDQAMNMACEMLDNPDFTTKMDY